MPTAALPQGSASIFLQKDQTAFGTAATGTFIKTFIYSETLEEKKPPENDPLLGIPRTNDRDQTAKGPGLGEVTGQIVRPFDFNHLGLALKGAFGAAVTTGSADPWVHTFTSGGAVLPHRTMESKISATHFKTLQDCLTTKLTFEINYAAGYARVIEEIIGTTETKLTTTGGGTPAAPWAIDQATNAIGAFKVGGTQVANITSFKGTYDNKPTPLNYIGTDRASGHEITDFSTFEGEIEMRFLDSTYYDLAVAGTPLAASQVWSKSGSRILTLTQPRMLLERSGPKIEGPGGIKQSFNFWCEQSSSAAMMTAVLRSLVAAY